MTQPRMEAPFDQACRELVTLKLRSPIPAAGWSALSDVATALTSLSTTPPPRLFQVLDEFQSAIMRLMKTLSLLSAVPTLTVRAAALVLAPAGIWLAAVPKRLSKRIRPWP